MASVNPQPRKIWQRQFWFNLFRVAKTNPNSQTAHLGVRQIYILPTRWGVLYGLMLLLMLIGSINYSLSLGYFITFLLTSLGHTAMLHTWRNLVHLDMTVNAAQPVFAGGTAHIPFTISDPKNEARNTICAQLMNEKTSICNIDASGIAHLQLSIATATRGYLSLPRIKIFTEYPLSFFHTWAYVQSTNSVLVYPTPASQATLPAATDEKANQGTSIADFGDDDFVGHKTYQVGDAPSRVDWRASSRGLGMLTKRFSGNGQSVLWLNWQDCMLLEKEARISEMTRWVIDAHEAGLSYGINVPNGTLDPSNSETHYHQALSLLALMP